MTRFHAVVWLDHHSAQVVQFDAEEVQVQKVQAQTHDTRQHGRGVRDDHELFGAVCDALAGITEVVVTGSKTALSDFRHYVDKHRHPLTVQIVGFETVDHPTEGQLVAFARRYFDKHDRMTGTPSG